MLVLIGCREVKNKIDSQHLSGPSTYYRAGGLVAEAV